MVGPKVPVEITQERAKRFAKTVEQPKLKQMFDPTKSVNDEVKKQIVSNLKSVKNRFED